MGSGRVWTGTEALSATHQTWLRDPASGQFLLDVFREPHEGGTWICRRDASLRLPYDAVVERTAQGFRTWYRSWCCCSRPRRRAPGPGGLRRVLPLLGRARTDRLGAWLERVHPEHPWLAELAR
ncbi:hypothetical protein NKH77_00635 [Streptomyces sp. M19]